MSQDELTPEEFALGEGLSAFINIAVEVLGMQDRTCSSLEEAKKANARNEGGKL